MPDPRSISPVCGRIYACGVDAEAEVTCDHCPDPDGCIDASYRQAATPVSGRSPQHDWYCVGGAYGWEVWACTRCKRSAIPNVFGFLWPSLARWVPFTGRWRCSRTGLT